MTLRTQYQWTFIVGQSVRSRPMRHASQPSWPRDSEFRNHRKSMIGTRQERIISVVVDPMIRLRMREWP
jgi:hypothetical protein